MHRRTVKRMPGPRKGSIAWELSQAVRVAFGGRKTSKTPRRPAKRRPRVAPKRAPRLKAPPPPATVACGVCGERGHNARSHKRGETDFLGTMRKAREELHAAGVVVDSREFDERPPLPPAPPTPAPVTDPPPATSAGASQKSEVDNVTSMSDAGADGRASATSGSGTAAGAGAATVSSGRRDLGEYLETLRPWFGLLGTRTRHLVELRAGGLSAVAIAQQEQRSHGGVTVCLNEARKILERHRDRLAGQPPGPDDKPRVQRTAAPRKSDADRNAELEALRPWFPEISESSRAIVEMVIAGKPTPEIAAARGIAMQTVYVAISSARARMRKLRDGEREPHTPAAPAAPAAIETPEEAEEPPAAEQLVDQPTGEKTCPKCGENGHDGRRHRWEAIRGERKPSEPTPAPEPLPTEWEEPQDPTGRRPGEIDPEEDLSEFFSDDDLVVEIAAPPPANEVHEPQAVVPADHTSDDELDVPEPRLLQKVRRKALAHAGGGTTRPRSVTIPPRRLMRDEVEAGKALEYPDVDRPQSREECQTTVRPCPFVSCSHHLYLDVNPETGAIKLNFPHLEVWEMAETCSLDVADRGGVTLEEVGAILNLTRERIRQVEVTGLGKMERHKDELGLPPERRERD
jgi:hypothetical protein